LPYGAPGSSGTSSCSDKPSGNGRKSMVNAVMYGYVTDFPHDIGMWKVDQEEKLIVDKIEVFT
jgi:hypothetical protein